MEFAVFVAKQAWACLFGALLLAAIAASRLWYPEDAALSRNDALVIFAVVVQILLVAFRLETGRELWVVVIFHVVGTGMELFKTDVGSWQYAGDGVLRIGGVPLYTGFMYASVGSYMVRVFRLFDLRFARFPSRWLTVPLAVAIYVNFFTQHYIVDVRWVLLVAALVIYGPCLMSFRNHRIRPRRTLPLLVPFVGVAFFIWVAENIGTLAGAWAYPNQTAGWELVSPAKLVSWFLLMIISVTLVTFVYRPRPLERE